MEKKSLRFSIIVGIKNIGDNRLFNFLRSLEEQSGEKHFELIIVDFGSDNPLNNKINFKDYGYTINYVYTNTKGHLWNRAACLNVGLLRSKGEIALIADVDLIFDQKFFERISKYDYSKSFYTFSCYYLTETFEIARLFKTKRLELVPDIDFEKKDYVGLCAVSLSAVKRIDFFDQFYMIWGAEDDDFYKRLAESGIERFHIDTSDLQICHQWHSNSKNNYPSSWYLTMVNAFFRPGKKCTIPVGEIISASNRPALNLFFKGIDNIETELELYYEKHLIFYKFFNDFFAASKKTAFKFVYIKPEQFVYERNVLTPFLRRFKAIRNQIEGAIGESSKFQMICEFVEYFVCTNLIFIEDYYLEKSRDKIELVLIKK